MERRTPLTAQKSANYFELDEFPQSALAVLTPYRWSPTFAFIDPDGVEAHWELLEALAAHKRESSTTALTRTP